MTTALVTGARGFIGRHIVAHLLARGIEVIAVARTPDAPAPGLRWLAADLLTPEGHAELGETRADILIHAAWETRHGYFWHAEENRLWEAATLALVDGFLAAGGQRVIALGTCMEYDLSGGMPLVESSTPLQPTFAYAIAKDRTRIALSELCAVAGARLVWARVFHLFGPHEYPNRLASSVIRALLAGEEARTTAGTQTRDFLSAADCGAAIAHLALSDIAGPVNIGSGAPITIATLVDEIAGMLSARSRVRLGALPSRPDDPPVIVPSVARLQATGFVPARPRAERLAETIAFWKAELRL